MKWGFTATILVLTLSSPLALAQADAPENAQPTSFEQMLETLRADSQAAEARDNQRLQRLLDDRKALQSALSEARDSLTQARQRREALEGQQAAQQARLDALNQRRDDEAGDLESVYDVARRHAGELRDTLGQSWLTVGGQAQLPQRLDEQGLLDVSTLEALGEGLMALTLESGRGVRFMAPVADATGAISEQEVIRLGAYTAFSQGRLLNRSESGETLAVAEHTPGHVADRLSAFQRGQGETMVFDPTQGQVLAALAQQPTLWERFNQGGAVGYVIVVLGAFGLLVALAQYIYLLRVTVHMRRQLQHPDQLSDDNPLGRVLARFNALGEGHAPEALEARLDEAMLAEQPRLERGQPMVKLLAGVAPLMGLLGTVTGMIVTFQSITVFGTGDPKLMAGGISQALVTTVLGLVVAVPLLLAQTAMASRSKELVGILEGRASAMLAEHLESRREIAKSERHATPA